MHYCIKVKHPVLFSLSFRLITSTRFHHEILINHTQMYLRCICTRVANVPNVFKVNQRLLKVGQKTPPQLACAVVEFIRNKNELCDVLGIKFSFAFLSVGKALYFAFHLVLLRVYSILFRAGILFHPCFSMFLSNISISFHVLGYIFFISLYPNSRINAF